MILVQYDNINDFLLNNEELLLERESFHNLILGLAYGIRDKKIEDSGPLYYSILDENNLVIASALRSNEDRPLILTEMPPCAVDLLIMDLSKSKTSLKAVVGEETTATYFKDQWTNLHKLSFNINIHLGVYECFKVILPKVILGDLVEASIEHKIFLIDYLAGFQRDCFPHEPILIQNIEKLMKRHLENRSIYLLLKDKEIVSMAANTRSTLNGGTISLVYTPPHLRGKGYASSVVALLASKVMNDGKKFASLFTDLTNPTSNSIYQKIGFIKIGQNIHYNFIEKI
jgi:ribosomal protein S18 acetylase RimI-like enzyme